MNLKYVLDGSLSQLRYLYRGRPTEFIAIIRRALFASIKGYYTISDHALPKPLP